MDQLVRFATHAAMAAALTLASGVAFAEAANYNVKIDGMTCDSCVNSVSAALAKIPGVSKDTVKVVLKDKKATLTVAEDKKEISEQIKKAIQDAGYTVTEVSVASATTTTTTPATATKKN